MYVCVCVVGWVGLVGECACTGIFILDSFLYLSTSFFSRDFTHFTLKFHISTPVISLVLINTNYVFVCDILALTATSLLL